MTPTARTTFTTVRTLSHSQLERRERLLAAARELAAEGGYPAVTMHDVADRAQVARATVYRYFSSKDQLLTAVSAAWAREATNSVPAQRSTGSAADTVAATLGAIIDRTGAQLPLTSAVVLAVISGDPTAERDREELYAFMLDRFDVLIGDDMEPADRAQIGYLLGHLLLAAFTSMCTMNQSVEVVRGMLTGAAHRLMP
ncbi:TetR/AcrR family transcriptional regulator [Nocardia sp. XZ_19_385]|uniref:TetR/AcrR family transcriptional regulator n=1 Tax=Nocardia sp. XZ_19_385 TaxID=2769488 RepID=UPI00188F430E|nr:TetR/AcrR family transcriptional regulator [Nocardia sp. XZ_19_385]